MEIWKGGPSIRIYCMSPVFQFYCTFMLNVFLSISINLMMVCGLWSRVELRDSPSYSMLAYQEKKHQFFNWKLKNVVKFLKINWLYYMVFDLPINILCLFSKFFTQKKIPTTLHSRPLELMKKVSLTLILECSFY